jgi:cell division transport system ATP-binding protein
MPQDNPIISLHRVMLHYGDGTPVFKNVSLSLHENSFHFLTGPSGAGKTSLMRLLYMGIKPSSGTLKIFNRDVSEISRDELYQFRQKIGVVFQDYNLLSHLNVIENVALPLKIRGEREKNRDQHAKEILDWVGLGNCFNAYPDTLSGGQKQRVAIARAVICRPKILLADEPTGNVDVQIADKLMNLFYGMHKIGTCVIVATHYRQFVDTFHYDELKIESHNIVARRDDEDIMQKEHNS